MNRQTLDKLHGLDFEFPDSYDEVADMITASRQKEGENARISKIDILADSNNKKNVQIYTVRITLSTSFYHNDVFIKVNGIEYQASRKNSLLGLNKYYATIIIDLETATTENGKLNVAAFLKKRDTGKVTANLAKLITINSILKTEKNEKDDDDQKDIKLITIHIYWNNKKDGRVEKFIPKKLEKKFENKIEYIYHDKQNTIHYIGIFDQIQIENRYDDRYVPNKKEKSIFLVNILQLQNYLSKTVFFRISHNTSPKTDRNIYSLASLLGAMLECSFNDFTSNGFSNSKGESVGGSSSHKNGINGDMRYLRKDKSGKNVHLNLEGEHEDPCGWLGMDEERQNLFNDAMYKFGWKSMLSFKYNGKLLNHSKPDEKHNDHLHLQNYSIPNFKEIIVTLLLFIFCACSSKENKSILTKKNSEVRKASKDSIILSSMHKPNFILGDFDGDMLKDTVQLTENLNNKKYGLRYLLASGERKQLFMGEILFDIDDIFWAGIFELVSKGDTTFNNVDSTGNIITEPATEQDKIVLPNDAVYIHEMEHCGGGIIYWDGKKFVWVQQE